MALSTPGIGSGLDVNSIVSQLMAVERQPLTDLDKKEASYQAKLSAYGNLKSALSSFQGTVSALNSPSKYTALSATAGDSTILSAQAFSTASPSAHMVEVTQLAQAQTLKTTFQATNVTDPVGVGTLTFYAGTYDSVGNTFTSNPSVGAQTVTIDSAHNSLSGVRDAINAANIGVSASIVNDGTSNRLLLTSKSSGAANSMKITVSDPTSSGLAANMTYDPTGVKSLTETVQAKDAKLLVDGISITSASNSVSGAIQGVSLSLTKTNVGSPTTLTVARDPSGISTMVSDFVKGYNDLAKTIKDLSSYDAQTQKGGVLLGDSAVRSIQSQMRAVLNTAVKDLNGSQTSLSSIGVSFQKDGTLTLDNSKLSSAISSDPVNVAGLFTKMGKSSDSLILYTSSTSNTLPGSYPVNITSIATQGKMVASAAAGLTITAGSNDALGVLLDGVSASVTLTPGTYTAATLLTEVQSRINGAAAFSSVGIGVTVSDDGTGKFSIASNSYGSASSVSVGGNGATNLLGGTPTSSLGVDVAGTIGGQIATGSGQFLTGGNGLKIMVNGGATGSRGSLNFAQGYAFQLNNLITNMLGTNGTIDSRTQGVNNSIKDIGNRRVTLNNRMTRIEAMYRKQFTNLDTLISNMQSTSNYLTQQLASISANSK